MSICPKILVSSLVFAVFVSSCTNRANRLPDYGAVPPFTMTDSQGRTFSSSELAGKVWIVDFIYTRCPGPCPLMTAHMHRVQQQVARDPDVELVSISVDPDHDSPAVLNQYAHHFGGPSKDWVFLTGSPSTIHLLAYQTFHVGDVINKMDHSTRFMLVDKRGHVRGYYSTFDANGIPTMLKDVAALRHQRS